MQVRDIRGTASPGRKVGVVVSEFNRVITDGLLSGVLEALDSVGADAVTIVRVPGALELPLTAQRLIDNGHEVIVAVGAVIRGETDHYEHVATQSIAGLAQVSLANGVPIGNAVLTVNEFEHASDRSQPGPGNKGFEAAIAALTTIDALDQVPVVD